MPTPPPPPPRERPPTAQSPAEKLFADQENRQGSFPADGDDVGRAVQNGVGVAYPYAADWREATPQEAQLTERQRKWKNGDGYILGQHFVARRIIACVVIPYGHGSRTLPMTKLQTTYPLM